MNSADVLGESGGSAMEVSAMEGIRAIESLGRRRMAGDVAPAFAVEGAKRVEEDLFESGARGQDRGIDEEEADKDEDQASKIMVDDAKQVDLFA